MSNLINILMKVTFTIMVGAFIGMVCSSWLIYVPGLKYFAVYSGPIFWRTLFSLVFLMIAKRILQLLGLYDTKDDKKDD